MVGIAKIKKVYKCQICRNDCFFHFYGVRSCEGCKQFFRRVVIKHLRYVCQRNQQCDILKGERCRGCRLDKCLLMGMDPKMVQIDGQKNDLTRQFINSLEEKQREMLQQNGMVEQKIQDTTPLDDTQVIINFLAPLERAYSRIWESPNPLPSSYWDRHANMGEFLNDNGNPFLQSANTYFLDESSWDKATWLEHIENNGFCGSNYNLSFLAKDWYLCFEGAKAMPFFKQLEKSDQVALMSHIVNSVNGICGAYVSSRKGAKTLTRTNGFMGISMLEAKQFRSDQRLQFLYQKMCNNIVDRISSLDLGHDEYLLIFALAFLASDATGLSKQGRDLIYAESVRYTQALHKLLQTKFGTFLAAQKLAAAINLLELANRRRFLIGEFVTHMEYFHEKRHPMDAFPRAIKFGYYL